MNCNFKTMVNAELDNHKLIHKVKKKREKTALKARIVKMKVKIIEMENETVSKKKPQEFYTCHRCFVCFKNEDKLAKHDKFCKDQQFQCIFCSCSYQIEYHLKRHISLKHSLETSPIRNLPSKIGYSK